eukprot:g2397.t1
MEKSTKEEEEREHVDPSTRLRMGIPMSQSIQGKYGVVLDRDQIVHSLLAYSQAYNGATLEAPVKDWNAKCADTQICDIDKRVRYKFKLDKIRVIKDLEKAWHETFKCQDALKSILSIRTNVYGHASHAVAGNRAIEYPSINIRALNSWGADRPNPIVDKASFVACLLFDPVLTEVFDPTEYKAKIVSGT